MMVAYNFLDTYLPTRYCRIVKSRKSKPTLSLHVSFASRVWAYRVLASFSSNFMPLSHSWIVSLHRWMPSHVLWNTTKSRVKEWLSDGRQGLAVAAGFPLAVPHYPSPSRFTIPFPSHRTFSFPEYGSCT